MIWFFPEDYENLKIQFFIFIIVTLTGSLEI